MSETDHHWMKQALELAERGRGSVEPNPLVGAVLVRDGQVVGAGWHERYGGAHAEVNALAKAGARAAGATLYVTLEPCCHFGKTPPCTDAVLKAGVGRVVAAMLDPFPHVAGQGVAQLRSAGVAVDVGIEEAAARRLNAPYLKVLATAMPYVHAKWAMSLDGKIAAPTGDSKWISSRGSRQWVHALRGRMDAIVVGIGTALADDPLLTARPPGPRIATRIVLDSRGRLPADSQLARTARDVPVIVAVTERDDRAGLTRLQECGCEILHLPSQAQRIDVQALLAELGRRRATNVLVEGGASIMGSFRDADAIDEVHVFIAPRLMGGTYALSPIAGHGVQRIADSLKLSHWEVSMIGDEAPADVLIHGWR